jgi:hypothetical protein
MVESVTARFGTKGRKAEATASGTSNRTSATMTTPAAAASSDKSGLLPARARDRHAGKFGEKIRD